MCRLRSEMSLEWPLMLIPRSDAEFCGDNEGLLSAESAV